MKLFEVLKFGKNVLDKSKIDNAEYDAFCLFESAFEMNKSSYFLHKYDDADENKVNLFYKKIEERKNGRPLQYILGKWDFMDYTFNVHEGVLIPRQDTETLVEITSDYISSHDVKAVFDLCSGSGCIGISLAKMHPDIKVYCFEISDIAIECLIDNIRLNNADNVEVIKYNVLEGFKSDNLPLPDVIVSNPPYIESDEIQSLQAEVLKEPVLALDGGKDGLVFYRSLASDWMGKLDNAFIAIECGETQAYSINKLFSEYSDNVKIYKDLNNIERVVTAERRK